MIKLDSKIPSGKIQDKWTNHKFNVKLVNPANKRKYEIIVVGTGLAGASAASAWRSVASSAIPNPATPACKAALRVKSLRGEVRALDSMARLAAKKEWSPTLPNISGPGEQINGY